MKLIAFGKKCGVFANDRGEAVNFSKVFAVKPSEYVDQKDDGVNITVGGECNGYRCTADVFVSLPDSAKDYDGGLPIIVEFDDKQRIIHVDLA